MPPKGYKKGYIKHPDTDEWVDPRVLKQQREEKPPPQPEEKITVVKKKRKKTAPDDLGPEMKSVSNDTGQVKILISWRDERGRQRNTQYVMADLTINENVHETFTGARKKTHLQISLDGTVLEKS